MQALYKAKDPKKAKLLHVMSSAIKAGATWSRGEIMQHCRECCGGQGFLAANKIGPMKNDMVRLVRTSQSIKFPARERGLVGDTSTIPDMTGLVVGV